MKKVALIFALLLAITGLKAQVTGQGLPEGGKEGEYGEWKKATGTLADGTPVTFEYRLKFRKKTVLACNYDLEIKNTGTAKFTAIVDYSYYDRLVNRTMGEGGKTKVKPGDSSVVGLLVQGCKRKKDESKDLSDYDQCRSCGLEYIIKVE